jgi:hypothetical protein
MVTLTAGSRNLAFVRQQPQPTGVFRLIDMAAARIAIHDQWRRLHSDLRKIEELQDDWDGDGTPAPSPEALATAALLLQDMESDTQSGPPSQIVPTANGTVCFEWHSAAEHTLLDVSSSRSIRLTKIVPGARQAEVLHLTLADFLDVSGFTYVM